MSRVVLNPTTVPVTRAGILVALTPIERVLEGLIDSANIYTDGDKRHAEISSSIVSDLAEQQRPVTGNKFFGHETSADEDSVEDTIFTPLMTLMKQNVKITPEFGRAVFTLNPQTTEYIEQRDTGLLVSGTYKYDEMRRRAANNVRENKTIRILHPHTRRPVTRRRLIEILDSGAVDFGGESDYKFRTLSSGGLWWGIAQSGIKITDDTPVMCINRFRDTNISDLAFSSNFSSTILVGGESAEELWFNCNLELTGGIEDDEYYTEIVDIVVLFEEVP